MAEAKLTLEERTKTDRPMFLRHRSSGVWIGYLQGKGEFPDSIRVVGRRIWSWRDDRLECSQVAEKGCRSGDRLGEWEEVDIGSITVDMIEFRNIKGEVVEASKEFAADGE